VLSAAPAASLVGLFAWAALDVAAVRVPGWNATLAGLLGAAGVLSLIGWLPRGRPVAWLGLVGLGAAYVGSRLVAHGLDVLPALAFVTLAIVHGELRTLAERFGLLYGREVSKEARGRIDEALARAVLRLVVAGLLAVLVPVFAADLALAGAIPATSIGSAVLLAGGLVVVAALLALLPLLGAEREA
jgi:hypothetical protein